MAQNNKLKRRAQAFMADHEGVTYLNALKAVDEPLHQLRDLFSQPRFQELGYTSFFRLVVEQGSYAPVTVESGVSGYRLIEELGLFEYKSLWKFIDEMASRKVLLKRCNVSDIWEYRALRRSGLLGSGVSAPPMDPIFHSYDRELRAPFAPMYATGSLGIFPLNVSPLIEMDEIQDYIPVTLKQLRCLESGQGTLGEIIAPPRAQEYDPKIADESTTDHYDFLAVSKHRTMSYNLASMSILYKGSLEEFRSELKAKGLKPSDFKIRPVSGEIRLRQFGGYLSATEGKKSLFEISKSQNALLWGTQSPALPTILEAAESIGLRFERDADGSFILDSEGKISTACPFHEDTDSFILQPDQGEHGSFMCYSCGRNGGPERLQSEWENRHSLDPMTE